MNEQNFCRECERPVNPENCHMFDGSLLCDDCYRSLTVECSCCGTRIWREDSEGNESIVLCQRCWDDHYCTCEECGALIANNEAWYEDGCDFPYCRECFNRKRNRPIKQYNYKPIFSESFSSHVFSSKPMSNSTRTSFDLSPKSNSARPNCSNITFL